MPIPYYTRAEIDMMLGGESDVRIIFYTNASPKPIEGGENILYVDRTNLKAEVWNPTISDYDIITGDDAPITYQEVINALGFTPIETETDPTVPQHVKNITEQNILDWSGAPQWTDILNKPTTFPVSYTNTNTNPTTHEVAIVGGHSIQETVTALITPTLSGNILTLKFSNENGIEQSVTVDLSSITTNDINVDDVTWDAATNILTVIETDGTEHPIDLSEFSIVTTTDLDGITTVTQEGVTKFTISKIGQTGQWSDILGKPATVVESVTGGIVDNTDPANPVINSIHPTSVSYTGLDTRTLSIALSDNTTVETTYDPKYQIIEHPDGSHNYTLRGYGNTFGATTDQGDNIAFGYNNDIVKGWSNFVIGQWHELLEGSSNIVSGYFNTINRQAYGGIITGAYNTLRTNYSAIFGQNNKDIHTVGGSLNYPDGGNVIGGFNNTIAEGWGMGMFGSGHIQKGNNVLVAGQASVNLNGTDKSVNVGTDARFIVGNGTINAGSYTRNTPSNAFVVYHNGLVVAPSLTSTLIDTEAKALVTREYLTAAIAGVGGGTDGVQSVTGDAVDNTDPLNPIINIPTVTSSRFGFTGEDDTLNENRAVDGGGFNFAINNTNSLLFDNGTTNVFDTFIYQSEGYGEWYNEDLINGKFSYLIMDSYQFSLYAGISGGSHFGIYASEEGVGFFNGTDGFNYLKLDVPKDIAGTMPLSVNGIFADATGNIVVPIDGGGTTSVSWADITNTPTTLSGFGITDGVRGVTGSAVDNTDPLNPIINIPSGGGGVQSVTGDAVDNTDPLNPIIDLGTISTAMLDSSYDASYGWAYYIPDVADDYSNLETSMESSDLAVIRTLTQGLKFVVTKNTGRYDFIGDLTGDSVSLRLFTGFDWDVQSEESIRFLKLSKVHETANYIVYNSVATNDSVVEPNLGGMYDQGFRVYVHRREIKGGGGGIQSVTGTGVDNTDPLNPVINVKDGVFTKVGTAYGDSYILDYFNSGNVTDNGGGNFILGMSNNMGDGFENLVHGGNNVFSLYAWYNNVLGGNNTLIGAVRTTVIGSFNTASDYAEDSIVAGWGNTIQTLGTAVFGAQNKETRSIQSGGTSNLVSGYYNELFAGLGTTVLGRFNKVRHATDNNIDSAIIGGVAVDYTAWQGLHSTAPLLLLGNGTHTNTEVTTASNAFGIAKTGEVYAFALDNAKIAAANGKVLITKEYLEANAGGGSTTETDPIFVASEAYGITAIDKTNWTDAYNKKVTAVTVTGDENKILTLTFQDSTTLTASFTDMQGVADGDEYVNSLNFDSTNGVLTVGRTGTLTDITVSLDGRYLTSLPAHGHDWSEITGKPTEFNPTDHTHVWGDITGVPTFDNYVSWNLKTNGVQRTTVQSGGDLDIVVTGNGNVSYSAGGVVTIDIPDQVPDLSKVVKVDESQSFTGTEQKQGRDNILAEKRSQVRVITGANPTNQNLIDWESDILLVKQGRTITLPASGVLTNGSRYLVKTTATGTVQFAAEDGTVTIEYNDVNSTGYMTQRSEAWVLFQDDVYYVSGEVM